MHISLDECATSHSKYATFQKLFFAKIKFDEKFDCSGTALII